MSGGLMLYVCTRCGLCNADGTHQDAACPVGIREGNAIVRHEGVGNSIACEVSQGSTPDPTPPLKGTP
jgi:hypothetical protein